MIGDFVSQVEAAVAKNPRCSNGLFGAGRVVAMERGLSGRSELLAFLFCDERCLGYWYGYVGPHQGTNFVALIAWLKVFVNAPTVPLLFSRFHYWTKIRLEYEPCTIQREDDAFALSGSFSRSVQHLIAMIDRFDIARRCPDEDTPAYNDLTEMRVFDTFGLVDHADDQGRFPGPPMQERLRIVK